MNREVHVRFCESVAVRFLRATRPVAESFFATLEKELLDGPMQTRSSMRKSIADYIETYYNSTRLHSHLDYVSPLEYELMAA
jgi:transposase InsO family protein